MVENYKQKDNVPDLYSILGLTINVCEQENCDEKIQKAYLHKVKLCHPDKNPGRSDVAEIYELITIAYDILKDPIQRTAYNHKLSLNKQNVGDYFRLKKQAEDYTTSIGQYIPATDRQKLSFEEQMKILDNKHGYHSTDELTIHINDAKKRVESVNRLRAVQDIELKHDRLFADGTFDPKKFNQIFDKVHNREEDSIVPHNGIPSAWNDLGTVANFSSFDNLDNIYVEDNNRLDTSRSTLGSINFGNTKKISKKDMDDLTNTVDYFDQHGAIGDDYYRDLKSRLNERDSEGKSFEKMKYNDFKKNDTAGYGIFDQLGIVIDDKLTFDDEDDIAKRFDTLMAERNSEQTLSNSKNKNWR
uniref:J domain-containing protein n=1 Tax=viral metagenome TaxID=1070528 RepID=A0A6C0LS12_9ZZZZ